MKFRLILLAATLLNVLSVSAATVPLYINSSQVVSPPASAPVIDATAFLNVDYFDVNNFSITPLPYETIRTSYFTNEVGASMWGHPGYFFEYTSGSTHSPMSIWHNRG